MMNDLNYPVKTARAWYSILWILLPALFTYLLCCSKNNSQNTDTSLRNKHKMLSISDAKKMIQQKKIFDKYWNRNGGFENDFEAKEINNDKVVVDHASGLIWHQSGSRDFKNLDEAIAWTKNLNTKEYAGHKNWRLPTLEEALSLMENQRLNGSLYIDEAFDTWQWCIITGDSLDGGRSWLTAFSGRVDWFDSAARINYVRPVYSLQ